jgi:cytoskeletal protein CcmA (bactofilin family)
MYIRSILSGLCLICTLQASATVFLSTNEYRVAAGATVAEEQWVLAGTAETEGIFSNDLFIACSSRLLLDGTHEGNIWGACNDAVFSGRCDRNVRLAGKSVTIDGIIEGNVMVLADTVVVTTNAVIGGSARLTGSSIILEGSVRGSTVISAARVVTLGGLISRNARITAPDLLLSRHARIGGNLTYTAAKEVSPAEGVVGGTVERIIPSRPPAFSADRLAARALWFMAACLVGIPFIALFPMTTAMASQMIRKDPWRCLLVGLLTFAALPIFGIMCASSIIGIPLGSLTLAAWGVMLYLSRIIVGLVLGTAILRAAGTSISRVLLAMAAGLALIYMTTLLPTLGIPIQIAVAWLGMGALILALLQKRRLIIQVPDELKHLEELKQQSKQKEETP